MTKVKQIGFVVLAITLLLGSCSKKKNNSPWVINEVSVSYTHLDVYKRQKNNFLTTKVFLD